MSAAAAQLLACWWSRPVAEERAAWAETWPEALLAADELGCQRTEVEKLRAAATAEGELLAEEFERLFVGPGRVPCPPYEALWRDEGKRLEQGRLMSSATAAVARVYRGLGVAVRPDAHELPDHLAVELEALACALSRGDAGTQPARELLEEHLLVWAPGLCAATAEAAQLRFYRRLALLTPAWLNALAELSG